MPKHLRGLLHALALLPLLLLPHGPTRAAAEDWPRWASPAGAPAQMLAEDMVLNGRRSRMQRMDMPEGMDAALKFFKQRLGPQHVVNQVQGATVVAGREGQFFHTVQLRAGRGDSVQATIMSSRIEASPGRSKVQIDTERLLPSDSSVLQTLESRDDGRRSLLLSARNQLSLEANQAHLLRQMKQLGLQPVAAPAAAGQAAQNKRVIWLQGQQEEAMLSIVDGGDARLILIQRTQGVRP